MPIALSFALLTAGYGYSPLEAFAAGATLSSTSLGTTLAALNSVSRLTSSPGAGSEAKKHSDAGMISCCFHPMYRLLNFPFPQVTEMTIDSQPAVRVSREMNSLRRAPSSPVSVCSTRSSPSMSLQQTRIGTVLTSAAIIDDVVGLVIAALIPALADLQSSSSSHSGLAWTLIRPLLSSLLIVFLTPPVARYILRPAFWHSGVGERWCAPRMEGRVWGWRHSGAEWGTEAHADFVKVSLMVCVLSAFVAIAYCE